MKLCKHCKRRKALSEFYPDRSGKKLGVGTYCKRCSVILSKKAYRRRKTSIKPQVDFKTCGSCQKLLPVSEFWRAVGMRDGFQSECKKCRKDRVRGIRYGLERGKYDLMLERQGGCCAVCSRVEDSLHVDHDHTTNKVRGLLCSNCNTAIGLAGDDPILLVALATYVASTRRKAA
jgi:hypothetical protein